MLRVIFRSTYKVKQGRKWVEKSSTWEEYIKDENSAKLRALALNWEIVEIFDAAHDYANSVVV